MPAPTAKFGAEWLSPTDIRSVITRIRANRIAHSNLLRNLGFKIEKHQEQVSGTLRGLDPKDRPSVVARAVSGMRGELVRETADQRLAHTRELSDLAERIKSGASHYRSSTQMLMRETLGSERRSRIMQQIANSGPVELASLAEFAASTKDKELAAALCSRVADLPRAERPFSATELADVIFGDLHRELAQAIVEAERRVLEGLNEDTQFETGKPNAHRSLQIALLKKREDEIGSYLPEDEDQDEDGGHGEQEVPDVVAEQAKTSTNRIAAGLQTRRDAAA